MSPTRKRYIARLIGRILILVICAVLCFVHLEYFDILTGMQFFHRLSWLHILWFIWVVDMVLQIIPIKNEVPLGSQKLWANRFRPIKDKINYESLRNYIISTTKAEAATYGDLTYEISNGEVTITDCKTSATGESRITYTYYTFGNCD